MKLIGFYLVLLISLLGIRVSFAQPNPNEFVEEKPVLMKNEATGGINFHTSGWGVQFRRSINLTGYKKLMFEGDFVGMKHPKEIKSVNQAFDNARSYVFGKKNSFHILRAGVGRQKTFFSKGDRNGVEIRAVYSGGLSLGILKPVFLNILEPTGTFGEFVVVTERYNPDEHFIDNIYGRAPFTEGLDRIFFRPGGYVKAGVNFEYAPFFEDVKALEIGIIADIYPKEIPIMAFTDNKQIFVSFYLTLMYGRKW
ncbi:MAG: hypothetical protein IPP46_03305 [Bacteroidetes bacterium]|nr:hypothetical protein [Bacteroidota bacterium]